MGLQERHIDQKKVIKTHDRIALRFILEILIYQPLCLVIVLIHFRDMP
jgi:hypothetical protein